MRSISATFHFRDRETDPSRASVLATRVGVRAPFAVRASTSRRTVVTSTRMSSSVRVQIAPTALPTSSSRVTFSRTEAVACAARHTPCASPETAVFRDETETKPHGTTTAAVTAVLCNLATASTAFAAEIDNDGVPPPNIFTTIGFTLAVALLAVITVGVLYLSLREALDKAEEQSAREDDARADRVIKANNGRVPGLGPSGGKKIKKKKTTPLNAAGDLGPNRRERRRLERSEDED